MLYVASAEFGFLGMHCCHALLPVSVKASSIGIQWSWYKEGKGTANAIDSTSSGEKVEHMALCKRKLVIAREFVT